MNNGVLSRFGIRKVIAPAQFNRGTSLALYMSTMNNNESSKANRKAAIIAANSNRAAYEATEFGRKRVKRIPKMGTWLGWIRWVVVTPCVYLYRRFRGHASATS
jgi:hypothetical protein